jgi:hypothetical protein
MKNIKIKESTVLLGLMGSLVAMSPVTTALAVESIDFTKATVQLQVKPTDKFNKDWIESTFCLVNAPQDILFVHDAKEIRFKLPDLPGDSLTMVFDQSIPESSDAEKDDAEQNAQKYRFTSRDTGAIWDLVLDPSGNTSCPGVWGYVWVNKLNIYRTLREALGAAEYRRCIRGESNGGDPVDCEDGVDNIKMTFWIGTDKWVGDVPLSPKRKVFNNSKNTEKFVSP